MNKLIISGPEAFTLWGTKNNMKPNKKISFLHQRSYLIEENTLNKFLKIHKAPGFQLLQHSYLFVLASMWVDLFILSSDQQSFMHTRVPVIWCIVTRLKT